MITLNRQWIEDRIPHKGSMCLLDEVLEWDRSRIRCRSGSHRLHENPLRVDGVLGIACGIEYAAQAMAVHGALVSGSDDRPLRLASESPQKRKTAEPMAVGLLASVRNVVLNVSRLDDIAGDLIATAQRVTGDRHTVLYEFSLASADRPLLSGRATIVFGQGLEGSLRSA